MPYLYGVLGSGLVEIAAFVKSVADNEGELPSRYKKLPYIITRLIFPCAAGAVPFAFEATKPLVAVYLGASAPIIIDRLASGILPVKDGDS